MDNNLCHLILKINLDYHYHPYSRYIRLISAWFWYLAWSKISN